MDKVTRDEDGRFGVRGTAGAGAEAEVGIVEDEGYRSCVRASMRVRLREVDDDVEDELLTEESMVANAVRIS